MVPMPRAIGRLVLEFETTSEKEILDFLNAFVDAFAMLLLRTSMMRIAASMPVVEILRVIFAVLSKTRR
jgi:hypothetical protein